MQSRAAILDAINKTITRSESLTEQAKATHRGSVEAAFSGAGFPAETKAKLAMIRKIQPNSGFAKGSVADTFGSTGHPSDELFPQGTGEIHEFSAEDLVSVGPKPDAPNTTRDFAKIMASQYPTIQAMQNVTPPTPGGTFEQRYSQARRRDTSPRPARQLSNRRTRRAPRRCRNLQHKRDWRSWHDWKSLSLVGALRWRKR